MKRFFLMCAVLAVLSLSSCQCSEPPEVGPVEEPEAQVSAHN